MHPYVIALIAIGGFAVYLTIVMVCLYEKGCLVKIHPMNKHKEGQIQVACVGDSITYGSYHLTKRNYPAVLSKMLGDGYCVNNFGFSGRTAMKDGDMPYVKDKNYKNSLAFMPDKVIIMFGMHFMERRGSGFKKIKADYRHAVNYRPEVEPMFRSTPTSFFATLYNLNYNVPIEKVLIDPEKIAVEGENVLIASDNLLIEAAIDSLNANKNTKENAKKLFAHMSFDGIFGRNDIMEIVNISITAAGNLINKLKEAELIESVTGQGKGKYKFVMTKE